MGVHAYGSSGVREYVCMPVAVCERVCLYVCTCKYTNAF